MSGGSKNAGEQTCAKSDKHEPAESGHIRLVAGEAGRVASVVRRVVEYVDVRKADTPNQETPEKSGKHSGGDRLRPRGSLRSRARLRTDCLRSHEFFSSAAVPERFIAGGAALLADVRGSVPDRKPIAVATAPQALAAGCDFGNRMTFSCGRHNHAVPMLRRWFPIAGSKGNTVRPQANAVAAPATVSGEPSVIQATGRPGRRREAETRKPGDLPSPWSIAGASAGVSRGIDGRCPRKLRTGLSRAFA